MMEMATLALPLPVLFHPRRFKPCGLRGGTATALSTSNAANYAVTVGAAIFANNARNSFTVIAPAPVVGDIDGDRDVDAADFARCVVCLAGPSEVIPASCTSQEFADCDLHESAGVDLLERFQ